MNLIVVVLFLAIARTFAWLNYFPLNRLKEFCVVNGEAGTYELLDNCQQSKFFMKVRREVQFEGLIEIGKQIKPFVCCIARVQRRSVTSVLNTRIAYANKHICSTFCTKLEDNINGGEDAKIGEFPHMAAIGYFNSSTNLTDFNCGGTLLSDKYVLTAAHCCESLDDEPYIVRLGRTSLDVNDLSDSSQVFESFVKKIHVPTERVRQTRINDIAILELETPVNFLRDNICNHIRPACIGQTDSITENRMFTIIGFGRKSSRGPLSNWLQKATIPEYSLKRCQESFKPFSEVKIVDSHICAFDEVNGRDACFGDSGSSLQTKVHDTFYIYGVSSYGKGCGSKVFPAVFTRVSFFKNWILKVIES